MALPVAEIPKTLDAVEESDETVFPLMLISAAPLVEEIPTTVPPVPDEVRPEMVLFEINIGHNPALVLPSDMAVMLEVLFKLLIMLSDIVQVTVPPRVILMPVIDPEAVVQFEKLFPVITLLGPELDPFVLVIPVMLEVPLELMLEKLLPE